MPEALTDCCSICDGRLLKRYVAIPEHFRFNLDLTPRKLPLIHISRTCLKYCMAPLATPFWGETGVKGPQTIALWTFEQGGLRGLDLQK